MITKKAGKFMTFPLNQLSKLRSFSILLFYTVCTFSSQIELTAAKAKMENNPENIDRNNDCKARIKIAKSALFDYESPALTAELRARFQQEYILRGPPVAAS